MVFIIWCIVFVVFNCLDMVTTYAAMGNKSASEIQKHEMNPLLDHIISHKHLTWMIKMTGIGFIIGFLLAAYRTAPKAADAESYLRVMVAISILMIFVVINNIHAKWAEDHARLSLGKFVTTQLHLPKIAAFYLIALSLFGLAYGIARIFY
jgi:uncharacterized protein YacL